MSNLKVRIKINPGRKGTPLDKLGEFATQSEKFLRALAEDLGLEVDKGDWLANRFTNESTAWDNILNQELTATQAARSSLVLLELTGDDPVAACNRGDFNYFTLYEFSKLGKTLDVDEVFYIGVYEGDFVQEPKWREVPASKTAEIRTFLETPFLTYGSVQGIVHSWHIHAVPPFFTTRELSTGNLVKCLYSPNDFTRVHEGTTHETTVIIVYGDMEWNRATNTISQLTVTNIETVKPLSKEEFENIFGSMPAFTGNLTTNQYVSWMRGDDEYND